MAFIYAVLGGGRQGTAAAYDMAKFGDASRVLIADISLDAAQKSAARVNDLISKEITGVLQLSGLCLGLLVVGAGRRFYDTRAYTGIYKTVSNEMVTRQMEGNVCVSKIAARANLFSEFIEFLENSIPGIFSHLIGLIGTLVIILLIFWDLKRCRSFLAFS